MSYQVKTTRQLEKQLSKHIDGNELIVLALEVGHKKQVYKK